MPRDVDGLWIGDRRVALAPKTKASFPLAFGEALVLKRGTAAVGVRVLWSRGVGEREPAVALVNDGNEPGVVRLTVTHYEGPSPAPTVVGAGAAFWVRVGSGLKDDAAFQAWRNRFSKAKADVRLEATKIALKADAAESSAPRASVEIAAGYPKGDDAAVVPNPVRSVLELNGVDRGRKILMPLEIPAPAPAAQSR
jgi:hypothetical protein